MMRCVTGAEYRWWVLTLMGVVILGCGGTGDVDREPVYPVTGVITRANAPLEGAVVSFEPTKGGRASVGTTDASGVYHLTTWANGDGAAAGRYRISVTKYEGVSAEESAAQAQAESEKEVDFTAEDFDEYPEGYDEQAALNADVGSTNVLPPKYASTSSSGLEAEVKADAENKIDFNLEG